MPAMSFLDIRFMPDEIARRRTEIAQSLLRRSASVRQPNFNRLSTDDLHLIVDEYDRLFFGSRLCAMVREVSQLPLLMRMSRGMTRSGGKTILTTVPRPGGGEDSFYEIAVSTDILFRNFSGAHPAEVRVGGIPCTDRLHALQLILEHELVHLAELLERGRSSCAGERFRMAVAGMFGHTSASHSLETVRASACRAGVHIGHRVSFAFHGQTLRGLVNRVGKRVTVLVPSRDGVRYGDGQRYRKFLVPIDRVQVNNDTATMLTRQAAALPPDQGAGNSDR